MTNEIQVIPEAGEITPKVKKVYEQLVKAVDAEKEVIKQAFQVSITNTASLAEAKKLSFICASVIKRLDQVARGSVVKEEAFVGDVKGLMKSFKQVWEAAKKHTDAAIVAFNMSLNSDDRRGVMKRWTYDIVDTEKVHRSLCEPDKGKIREAVNAGLRETVNGEPNPMAEGLKIYETMSAVTGG